LFGTAGQKMNQKLLCPAAPHHKYEKLVVSALTSFKN